MAQTTVTLESAPDATSGLPSGDTAGTAGPKTAVADQGAGAFTALLRTLTGPAAGEAAPAATGLLPENAQAALAGVPADRATPRTLAVGAEADGTLAPGKGEGGLVGRARAAKPAEAAQTAGSPRGHKATPGSRAPGGDTGLAPGAPPGDSLGNLAPPPMAPPPAPAPADMGAASGNGGDASPAAPGTGSAAAPAPTAASDLPFGAGHPTGQGPRATAPDGRHNAPSREPANGPATAQTPSDGMVWRAMPPAAYAGAGGFRPEIQPTSSGSAQVSAAPHPVASMSPAAQAAPAIIGLMTGAGGTHAITVQLQPDGLGPVHIQVGQTGDGGTLIHIAAERPETLQLLRKDQPALLRALDEAGVASGQRQIDFQITPPNPAGASADRPDGMGAGLSGFGRHGDPGTARDQNASGQPSHTGSEARHQRSAGRWFRAGLDITA